MLLDAAVYVLIHLTAAVVMTACLSYVSWKTYTHTQHMGWTVVIYCMAMVIICVVVMSLIHVLTRDVFCLHTTFRQLTGRFANSGAIPSWICGVVRLVQKKVNDVYKNLKDFYEELVL
ncbi:hypothetical protein ACOMHN_051641 [Nucella lapillus]